MAKILIVEDDRDINNLMKMNLTLVGHECTQCYDGKAALKLLYESDYDLVLLDVMLPGMSGFDLITKLEGIPTIFVTAKGQLEDKLRGLSLVAEDYMVKPFEMLELIARVGVVLKRSNKSEDIFKMGDTRIDIKKHTAEVRGEPVNLTPQEFKLLVVLIENKNVALSRDILLEEAWGYDYEGEMKTVDVHIQKLRKKLRWEKEIKTISKLGYRLETRV